LFILIFVYLFFLFTARGAATQADLARRFNVSHSELAAALSTRFASFSGVTSSHP
jgi:hypothetical protein